MAETTLYRKHPVNRATWLVFAPPLRSVTGSPLGIIRHYGGLYVLRVDKAIPAVSVYEYPFGSNLSQEPRRKNVVLPLAGGDSVSGLSFVEIGAHKLVALVVQNNDLRAFWSDDHALNWKELGVPAVKFSIVRSTVQKGRLVVLGFVPASGTTPGSWQVAVGVVDGTATNLSEFVAIPLIDTPTSAGDVLTRDDGVLEFSYVNDRDMLRFLTCVSLSNAGAGEWS